MAAASSVEALYLRCTFAVSRTAAAKRTPLTPNRAGTKRPRYLAATILCLLTLLLNTASCMHAQLPHPQRDASCGDCPKHAPAKPDTPVCCTAHQQPSAVATTLEVEQPTALSSAYAPAALALQAPSAISAAVLLSALPHPPPLVALRI